MANNTQELLTPLRSYTFTNNDLTETGTYGTYYLELVHNLNVPNPIVEWLDPNGVLRSHTGNIRAVDANTIVVYTGGTITGTHRINILQDKSAMLQGRRLFDQELKAPGELDPTYRFAIGRPGFATKNISISDFTQAVADNMGGNYLLRHNNLSDLTDPATARYNLDVYSKAEIDGNYLEKDDSDNLDILSTYVPVDYPQARPLDAKTILTYSAAQRLEHKSGILVAESTTTPWTNLTLSCHFSPITRSLRFNIRAELNTSAINSYEYVDVAHIDNSSVISELPSYITGSTVVYACEGMPLLNFVDNDKTLNFPASTSHLQVKFDNNRLVFSILPTVEGRIRPGLYYMFTGNILL